MNLLGHVNAREILYSNIRADQYWFQDLPYHNWIVFTIADHEDAHLLDSAIGYCLDKHVTYICCSGEIGSLTYQLFNNEITIRAIAEKIRTGFALQKTDELMTTMHRNFDEGFWYATTLVVEEDFEFESVICLDFTKKGVKQALVKLIQKLNNNWLPEDQEIQNPAYDS